MGPKAEKDEKRFHQRARVSVIMPIHNEEDYSSCSLEFQKKIDDQILEFIFILDRRTDNSEAFFRQCFPKTEIVKKETWMEEPNC